MDTMYYDSKTNRVLLRDGRSVVDSFEYARKIIEGKDPSLYYVIEDDDSKKYDLMEKTNTSVHPYSLQCNPSPDHSNDEEHLNDLIEVLGNSSRFDGSSEQIERIDHELTFFKENGHIQFVWELHLLVQKFKEDDVVWGVGRGSSCASLVMYLLEVNDIDPLAYNIPFSELSKVQDSPYE